MTSVTRARHRKGGRKRDASCRNDGEGVLRFEQSRRPTATVFPLARRERCIANMEQQSHPIKVALVGCGQIMTHHIAAMSALPPGEFCISALVDPSSERRGCISELVMRAGASHLAPSDGMGMFDALGDLLAAPESKPDAVFISVPHDLHVALAQQALDAGLNVVMEKPLAPTTEGCRTLLDASAASSGMLIISEQSPYWEEVVKAKDLLRGGKIGNLISASSYYYESMRDNVTSGLDDAGGLGWRASLKRAGGGIVIDGGLHWIRPIREFCGEVDSVVGVTSNAEPALKMEGETLAHALLKMAGHGGMVATFSANMMHQAPMAHDVCPYFRLTGTKGELVIYGTGLNMDGGGGLRLYDGDSPEGVDLFPRDRRGGFFLGFRGIWRAVSEILATDDRPRARETVRSAAADVGVALALYRSSESGQWEKCEQFGN